MRSLGLPEIIIILVVVFGIIFFARMSRGRRTSSPPPSGDATPGAGDDGKSNPRRRIGLSVLLAVLLGLIIYCFVAVYPTA